MALTPAAAPLGEHHRPPPHAHEVGLCKACDLLGVHVGAAEPLDLDMFPHFQLEPDLLDEGLRIPALADPDGRLEFLEQFIRFDISSPPDIFSDGRRQGR